MCDLNKKKFQRKQHFSLDNIFRVFYVYGSGDIHVFVRHNAMILSFKIASYGGTSIQRRARDWAKFVRHNEVPLYRRVLFHIFY